MLFDPFAPMTQARKRFHEEVKKKLSTKQGGKCMYCGRKPGDDLMDIDHKIPLSRGGSNNIRNLQILCRSCNGRKGNKTDREFRRMYKAAGVPQTQILPKKVISQKALDEAGKAVATARSKRQAKAKAANSDPFGGLFG